MIAILQSSNNLTIVYIMYYDMLSFPDTCLEKHMFTIYFT